MSRIEEVFDTLDDWRHLPNYQLERRADIFFALYLSEILQHRFHVGAAHIIPEFPIRVGEIYGDGSGNKSFKIDYLAITERSRHAVFVELKTDAASRRSSQDDYLARAREAGMAKLIDGLLLIFDKTKAKPKYRHLLKRLCDAGLVESKRDRYENRVAEAWKIDLLYIQPETAGKVISLGEVADIVASHPDDFSQRFAKSLREWDTVTAGTAS